MGKFKYPLYMDVPNESWVGDQEYVDENNIDTVGLLKVTEIKFSTYSDIESVPYEEEDVAEDFGDDEESRDKNDPVREAIRTTWPVVHIFYEYNGEYGCVARNLELYLAKLTMGDDLAGNVLNTELEIATQLLPITDESFNETMETLKTIIINHVKSVEMGRREKTFIEKFIAEANDVFSNLV